MIRASQEVWARPPSRATANYRTRSSRTVSLTLREEKSYSRVRRGRRVPDSVSKSANFWVSSHESRDSKFESKLALVVL